MHQREGWKGKQSCTDSPSHPKNFNLSTINLDQSFQFFWGDENSTLTCLTLKSESNLDTPQKLHSLLQLFRGRRGTHYSKIHQLLSACGHSSDLPAQSTLKKRCMNFDASSYFCLAWFTSWWFQRFNPFEKYESLKLDHFTKDPG